MSAPYSIVSGGTVVTTIDGAGDITTVGNLNVGGNGTITGNHYVIGSIVSTGNNTFGTVTATSATITTSTITTNNVTTDQVTTSTIGNLFVGTNGTVTGYFNVGGTGSITGNVTIGGTLVQGVGSIFGSQWYQSGGGINTSQNMTTHSQGAVTANGTAVIALGTGGTQLADVSKDYMLYLGCTTTGGATVCIGSTATATAATVFVGSVVAATSYLTVRVPAGYFVRITGTTAAFANQNIISC